MKSLFFCGHRSLYGFSHLLPLLESRFSIDLVIVATDDRWVQFARALSGETFFNPSQNLTTRAKDNFKCVFQKGPLKSIKNTTKRILGSEGSIELRLESICKKHNIKVLRVFDVNDDRFLEKIRNSGYEFIFSAAYPQIFSDKLISIPSKGAVNFHPSLLPKYRGAHPHYWTIAMGEKEGGITAHYMTVQLDKGDIITQLSFPIIGYTYQQYYDKIISETPIMIKMVEEFFSSGTKKATAQNDKESCLFRNDREIHHRIFWRLNTAENVVNKVRAGPAYFYTNNNRVDITEAYCTDKNRNMTNNLQVEDGCVVDFLQDSMIIKAKEGFLHIQNVRFRGRAMSFKDFAIKAKIQIGIILE